MFFVMSGAEISLRFLALLEMTALVWVYIGAPTRDAPTFHCIKNLYPKYSFTFFSMRALISSHSSLMNFSPVMFSYSSM